MALKGLVVKGKSRRHRLKATLRPLDPGAVFDYHSGATTRYLSEFAVKESVMTLEIRPLDDALGAEISGL